MKARLEPFSRSLCKKGVLRGCIGLQVAVELWMAIRVSVSVFPERSLLFQTGSVHFSSAWTILQSLVLMIHRP